MLKRSFSSAGFTIEFILHYQSDLSTALFPFTDVTNTPIRKERRIKSNFSKD